MEVMMKRSPLGSQANSTTVSIDRGQHEFHNRAASIRTFWFDDLDREILLPQAEYFQVAKDRFLRFCVTIDLDAKIIALVLPKKLALTQIR